MATRNTKLTRNHKLFVDDLKEMKMKRMKQGKETKISRLTLAIHRHPLFPKIKSDILEADLK